MDIESIRPFLAVVVPLLGTILIVATRKSPNVREGCSVTAAVLQFLIVATMIPPVLDGKTLHMTLFAFLPNAAIGFRVDGLGLVFAATASFLWVVTTFYSIGYMRSLEEKAQTRYYLCFALTLAATMGAAFAANLLTLYLFYEMITFVTYPLVAHKATQEAFAAGNKYVFYLLMSSKFFLLAIVLTYAFSGTLAFQPHGLFPSGVSSALLTLTFFLFLFGISKAAIMPLHAWLPAAMIAPTPVSALLHAVAVVNTGVFCILRVIFNVFGVELMKTLNLGPITALIASFTIIAASIYAFTRDDLKARLAYSTISQLSYIVLGGALLTVSGMTGGIMHIATHAFSKITLFFCAGSIYVASHKTRISQLDGIGKKMPWTMAAFTIGVLSIMGVPPLAGSVSKEHLIEGAITAYGLPTQYVMWASLLLNAGYFLPIIYRAFFKPLQQDDPHPIQEPSLLIVVPLLLCAVISVILGIYPALFADLAAQVVR